MSLPRRFTVLVCTIKILLFFDVQSPDVRSNRSIPVTGMDTLLKHRYFPGSWLYGSLVALLHFWRMAFAVVNEALIASCVGYPFYVYVIRLCFLSKSCYSEICQVPRVFSFGILLVSRGLLGSSSPGFPVYSKYSRGPGTLVLVLKYYCVLL